MQHRTDFVPEAQIEARTLERRAEFWAYLLEHLSDVVAALAEHRPCAHPWRVADFAQFCVAVGPVLGYPVEDVALEALEGERNDFGSRGSSLSATPAPPSFRIATICDSVTLDFLMTAAVPGGVYYLPVSEAGKLTHLSRAEFVQ